MKKQQGFAVLEAILVLVVVAVLVFAGWYVWHSRQSASNKPTDSTTAADQKTTANDSANTATSDSTGKQYSSTALGFSAEYPKTWTVKDDSHDTYHGVVFDSPDLKRSDNAYKSIITAGGFFYAGYTALAPNDTTTLDDMVKAGDFTNPTTTQVDSVKAITDGCDDGYDFGSTCVTFVTSGRIWELAYSGVLPANEANPTKSTLYSSEFDSFVKSFKFQ